MYEKGFCWGGCLNQASSLIIVTMRIVTMLIVSLNKEREDFTMIILTIAFAPLLFVGWCFVKTIEIVAGFLKFDMRCAAVKKKNPELYRQMKEEAFRMTNGVNSGYWIIHESSKRDK